MQSVLQSGLIKYASIPVVMKPNAGLPRELDGKTVFDVTPEEFAEEVKELVNEGVRVIGGCCGTTPEYIKLLCEKTYTCHQYLSADATPSSSLPRIRSSKRGKHYKVERG